MGLLAATISCVVMLGSCASSPQPPLLPVEQFAISYERSGGFASMPQKLTIRPGRHATLTAVDPHGQRRSVQFRVAAKKVKQLRAAAETAHVGTAEPSEPGNCADCFIYTVAYRGETASVAEIDVPVRMRGLISRMETLIAAHLPFH
jgi:hypothetical protein